MFISPFFKKSKMSMPNNQYFVKGYDLEYIFWQNQTKDRFVSEDGGGIMFNLDFDINQIISFLNNQWQSKKIPLKIQLNGETNKIKISSTKYLEEDEINQIHLLPKLAYILGYTDKILFSGQFLRMDQNFEYIAPHPYKTKLYPHSFSWADFK